MRLRLTLRAKFELSILFSTFIFGIFLYLKDNWRFLLKVIRSKFDKSNDHINLDEETISDIISNEVTDNSFDFLESFFYSKNIIDFFSDLFGFDLFCLIPEISIIFFIFFTIFSYIYNVKVIKKQFNLLLFLNRNAFFAILVLFFIIIFCWNFLLSIDLHFFFNDIFYLNNRMIVWFKIIISFFGCLYFFVSINYFRYEKFFVWEHSILIMLVILGSFIVLSANDFFLVFLGFEIISLVTFVIFLLKNSSSLSVEAGLRFYYFNVFFALLFLLALTFFFASSGLNFDIASIYLKMEYSLSPLCKIGFFIVFVVIFFKITIFPFQFWVADVIEGIPLLFSLFFFVLTKLPPYLFLIKLSFYFPDIFSQYSVFFGFLGFCSIFYSIYAIFSETRIKRFIAFSGVNFAGFFIVLLFFFSFNGIGSLLLALFLYFLNLVGFFLCLIFFRNSSRAEFEITYIVDLSLIFRSNFSLAICMVINLLSIGGLPFLSGFFGKFFLYLFLYNQGFYISLFIFFIVTLLGFVYIIRLLRYLFFISTSAQARPFWDDDISVMHAMIIVLIVCLNISFVFFSASFVFYFNSLIFF